MFLIISILEFHVKIEVVNQLRSLQSYPVVRRKSQESLEYKLGRMIEDIGDSDKIVDKSDKCKFSCHGYTNVKSTYMYLQDPTSIIDLLIVA